MSDKIYIGIDGKSTDELRVELSKEYESKIENARQIIKVMKIWLEKAGVEVDMQEVMAQAGVEPLESESK
jgi:hypothetical protein